MRPNIEIFNCKLYTKEEILNWNLTEKIQEKLDLRNNDFFFVSTPKESKHEGHEHVHLSIYPTKYEIINMIEVKTSKIEPSVLSKILQNLNAQDLDIITSTGFCIKNDECYLGIFYSKPENREVELVELKKIKEIEDINIFNYSCDGLCED